MSKKLHHIFVAIIITLVFFVYWKVDFKTTNNPIQKGAARQELVVYNKVAKCGSSSILAVTEYLSRHDHRYKVYQHPAALRQQKLGKRISKEVAEKEAKIVAELPRPALYSRHVYYINFTEFNLERPVYINMVRDPVDRFVSNFYFDQFGSFGQNMTEPSHSENINDCILKQFPRCSAKYFVKLYMTRYFCGHKHACNTEERAIEIAKRNIRNDYAFVGLTEEFENSLRIFEKLLPQFFLGALDAWRIIKDEKFHRYSTVHKEKISLEARAILREKMWADYEVYRFIKEQFIELKRLYKLY